VTKGIDLGAASGRFSQHYPGAAVASSKSKAATRSNASSSVGSAQAHTSPASVTKSMYEYVYRAIDKLMGNKKIYITNYSINMPTAIGPTAITVSYEVDTGNVRKQIEIQLFHRTFYRATHEIDQYAHLTDSLSDDDYIILRIAYILYQAQKLKTNNAMDINNSLCRITNYSETLSPTYFNF
jgi:hypothetical protein